MGFGKKSMGKMQHLYSHTPVSETSYFQTENAEI